MTELKSLVNSCTQKIALIFLGMVIEQVTLTCRSGDDHSLIGLICSCFWHIMKFWNGKKSCIHLRKWKQLALVCYYGQIYFSIISIELKLEKVLLWDDAHLLQIRGWIFCDWVLNKKCCLVIIPGPANTAQTCDLKW